ncbi:MAG: response regulator [Magnetococcales bacterium]|nr:response regulator [Magnetococcales bacterium]
MANILVVDDDPDILALVAEILQQSNHEVAVADSGREALAVMAVDTIDLIISDIFMPDVDGIDLLALLNKDFPHCPMLAISGGYRAMNSELTLRMARMFGAFEVIAKPFAVHTIQDAVNRALQHAALQRQPGAIPHPLHVNAQSTGDNT